MSYWPPPPDLTDIDVSEEDDADWEESVDTGDKASVQTRRQSNNVSGWEMEYLRDEGAGHLYDKSMQDQGDVEEGQATVHKYHLVDQRR